MQRPTRCSDICSHRTGRRSAERNYANANAAKLVKDVRETKVKLPSLESYEKQATEGQIILLSPLTSDSDRAARFGRTVG